MKKKFLTLILVLILLGSAGGSAWAAFNYFASLPALSNSYAVEVPSEGYLPPGGYLQPECYSNVTVTLDVYGFGWSPSDNKVHQFQFPLDLVDTSSRGIYGLTFVDEDPFNGTGGFLESVNIIGAGSVPAEQLFCTIATVSHNYSSLANLASGFVEGPGLSWPSHLDQHTIRGGRT